MGVESFESEEKNIFDKLKYVVPIVFILIPIIMYTIVFYVILSNKQSFTTSEFNIILWLNLTFFVIMMCFGIVNAYFGHKEIIEVAKIIKSREKWQNVGVQMVMPFSQMQILAMGPLVLIVISTFSFSI